jgi:hypothetical protein
MMCSPLLLRKNLSRGLRRYVSTQYEKLVNFPKIVMLPRQGTPLTTPTPTIPTHSRLQAPAPLTTQLPSTPVNISIGSYFGEYTKGYFNQHIQEVISQQPNSMEPLRWDNPAIFITNMELTFDVSRGAENGCYHTDKHHRYDICQNKSSSSQELAPLAIEYPRKDP